MPEALENTVKIAESCNPEDPDDCVGVSDPIVLQPQQTYEVTYRIVGVAPPSVDYPEPSLFAWVRSRTEAPEIAGFPSLQRLTGMRDAWYFEVVGRLAPDTGLMAARDEMSAIARDLEMLHPESNDGRGTLLIPLSEQAVAGLGSIILALAALTGTGNDGMLSISFRAWFTSMPSLQ